MESDSLTIFSFNKKGWGVGSSEKTRVEVVGAFPEEIVKVLLHRKRRGVCRGQLQEIATASPFRVAPRCSHVPECGGCTWQQLDYEKQLKVKQERLRAIFGSEMPLCPIIPCDEPWRYRNKMEFSFSQNKAGERFLGLVIAGSRGHVLNLQECHLVSPWFIEVLHAVYSWWEESGLAAYRIDDTGSLRTLILREGIRTGEKLVMLTVSGRAEFALKQKQIQSFVETVKNLIGQSASLFLRVQQVRKGFETQFFEMHLGGADHLKEKCLVEGREFTFKISPSSFFQPNTKMAEKIYATALQLISEPKEHILDLYSGIGTLGIVCAKRAQQVTCVELNPYAVYDAQSNKELNGVDHCRMLKGDVGKVLGALKEQEDFIPPDLVIVDPPRTGLDAAAMQQLLLLKSKEILYISCNAATQNENCTLLAKEGYEIDVLQPIDQFPHTVHIETIARLKKIK